MRRFSPVSGVLIEELGTVWAAFSPVSGASHVLNDSSAAILEILSEASTTASAQELANALSNDTGQPPADIEHALADHWDDLVAAGLIREVRPH